VLDPLFDSKQARYFTEDFGKKWPPRIVVSLSGGKDSMALLIKMVEEGVSVHRAVFVDTGWEFPEMYTHLDRLERYLGIEIVRLKTRNSLDEKLKQYRWPDWKRRWCTAEKRDAFNRYVKSLDQDYIYYIAMGYAIDEVKRIWKKGFVKSWQYAPLIWYDSPVMGGDWRMTEAECLAYCRSHGFDWGGLYEIFDRVSCFCCPLQKKAELRALRTHRPELWQRVLDMERTIPFDGEHYITFQGSKTAHDLERDFAYEESLAGGAATVPQVPMRPPSPERPPMVHKEVVAEEPAVMMTDEERRAFSRENKRLARRHMLGRARAAQDLARDVRLPQDVRSRLLAGAEQIIKGGSPKCNGLLLWDVFAQAHKILIGLGVPGGAYGDRPRTESGVAVEHAV